MKKIFNFLMASVALLSYTSCSSFEPKTIDLSGVTCNGDHHKYVKIVGDEAILRFEKQDNGYYKAATTLTFELTEVPKLKNFEYRYGNIQVNLRDQYDGKISFDYLRPDGTSEWDKFKTLLNGKKGDKVTVTFKTFSSQYKSEIKLANKEAVSFSVDRMEFSEIYNEPSYSSSSSSRSSSSSSSAKWDKILNDYEKYIDSYIAVVKKANAGDMSAMMDMASMLETASSMAEDLEDADDMSSTQMARYARITAKLTAAMY